jgi:hypothetical protein
MTALDTLVVTAALPVLRDDLHDQVIRPTPSASSNTNGRRNDRGDSGHCAMVSHPEETLERIVTAAKAVAVSAWGTACANCVRSRSSAATPERRVGLRVSSIL